MQRALVLGLLLVAAAAVSAAPASSTETSEMIAAGDGPMTEDLLDRLVEDPPEKVDIYTFDGDGMTKTKTVDFERVVDELERTSLGGEERDHGLPCNTTGVYFCPDHGSGDGQTAFFCDDSSGWIEHTGTPGETVLISESNGPADTEICNGFYGSAEDWSQVHMAPLASSGTVNAEGCFADTWAQAGGGYCPNPFSGQDTFHLHFRAAGPGVITSLDFGSSVLDYYVGLGSEVAYDHPPGDPV